MEWIAVRLEVSEHDQLVLTRLATEGPHHFQKRVFRLGTRNDDREMARLNPIGSQQTGISLMYLITAIGNHADLVGTDASRQVILDLWMVRD
ncbi:hypothetical protein D3C86_1888820 [compost metagenome]